MKKIICLPLALALALGVYSCKKKLIPGTYESQPASMGNGTIHSFASFDADAKPTAIGMVLTDAALENLPDSASNPTGNHHANIFEAQLPPDMVSKTPFRHVAVNWNPGGHMPPGIYDKPHFDLHFYMVSSDERKQIPEFVTDSSKFKKYPPAGYLPPDFFHPGGGEPKMGAHWISNLAPELPPNGGAPFTETWVYGTYDGKITFFEPMITLVHLKNITDFTKAIPRLLKVQISGYYPTVLRIKHADGKYTITIEQFEYRKAE